MLIEAAAPITQAIIQAICSLSPDCWSRMQPYKICVCFALSMQHCYNSTFLPDELPGAIHSGDLGHRGGLHAGQPISIFLFSSQNFGRMDMLWGPSFKQCLLLGSRRWMFSFMAPAEANRIFFNNWIALLAFCKTLKKDLVLTPGFGRRVESVLTIWVLLHVNVLLFSIVIWVILFIVATHIYVLVGWHY